MGNDFHYAIYPNLFMGRDQDTPVFTVQDQARMAHKADQRVKAETAATELSYIRRGMWFPQEPGPVEAGVRVGADIRA